MNASAVGKVILEADCAYLAGLIDGDGCIMATIERHPEKKFGWRVRTEIKITQKGPHILRFLARKYCMGRVTANRTTYDWIIRNQSDVRKILDYISQYSLAKKEQIKLSLKILNKSIKKIEDLMHVAQLADTLSKFNVRSKDRRKNYASMIKIVTSPND